MPGGSEIFSGDHSDVLFLKTVRYRRRVYNYTNHAVGNSDTRVRIVEIARADRNECAMKDGNEKSLFRSDAFVNLSEANVRFVSRVFASRTNPREKNRR